MTPHLTHDELAAVLVGDASDAAANAASQDHLCACPACSTELDALRQPLALFSTAASAFAEREYARPQPAARASYDPSLRPAWFALAAMALLVLLLPGVVHERRIASASAPQSTSTSEQSPQPFTAESDDALLSEVDQDIAASVPSPMQPLADPTHSSAYAHGSGSQSLTAQRK